jgi:PAS domain-containing protein
MLDSLKTLVSLRRIDHHLTRFNDLFERYLTYQRADLILHGVILDAPPDVPTVQSYTDLYARTDDLVAFDQERAMYASQLGREPTDDEVLQHIEDRDRVG